MQNDPEYNLKWAEIQIFLGEHVFILPSFGKHCILYDSTQDSFNPPLNTTNLMSYKISIGCD